MKRSGKRLLLRFTAWLSAPVVTPYSVARSRSSMTWTPRIVKMRERMTSALADSLTARSAIGIPSVAARPFACGDIVLFFIISNLFRRLCADAQQDSNFPKPNCLKDVSNLSQNYLARNRTSRRLSNWDSHHLGSVHPLTGTAAILAAFSTSRRLPPHFAKSGGRITRHSLHGMRLRYV